MVSTEAQEECPWIESMNSDCIEKTVCQQRGIGFYIWEDCALDSKLFDYNGTAAFSENCEYFSVKGKTISLKKLFNAETDNEPLKICSAIFLKAPVTQFYILDVNEFDPTPISQGLIFETHVKEGVEPLVIATVNYTDDDWKETEGLQVEMISADKRA
ncbi:uncharacterized protein LOC121871534 isoform X2 [Homarus americanus]|nr:uncharacterized protein LOC121871534 isoform X2 [Homarus americanus]XP_042229899.1 uncharacterized protein LOC121871534 isoform X2 [Homarus americanus]